LPSSQLPVSLRLLVLLGDLGAEAILLLAQLGRELLAEILGLEDLADFQLRFLLGAHRGRATLGPLDRLRLGLALPNPEPRDQLLGLGERAVDDGLLAAREEPDARPLGAGLEPFTGEHHAGFD